MFWAYEDNNRGGSNIENPEDEDDDEDEVFVVSLQKSQNTSSGSDRDEISSFGHGIWFLICISLPLKIFRVKFLRIFLFHKILFDCIKWLIRSLTKCQHENRLKFLVLIFAHPPESENISQDPWIINSFSGMHFPILNQPHGREFMTLIIPIYVPHYKVFLNAAEPGNL